MLNSPQCSYIASIHTSGYHNCMDAYDGPNFVMRVFKAQTVVMHTILWSPCKLDFESVTDN